MGKSFKISICAFVLLCALVIGYVHHAARIKEKAEREAASFDPALANVLQNNSVIKTEKITIPGYPRAYNPSLIPYSDGYLLSFRSRGKLPEDALAKKFRKHSSFIGVVKLNKNFEPLKKSVQILDIQSYASEISCTAEDARLLKVGERIFMFFNDIHLLHKAKGCFSPYFAELIEKEGRFVLKNPAKLLSYDKAIQAEKNWSPFVANNRLYLIYADNPRVILEADLDTGICQEITRKERDWHWNWGEVRGGTPAQLVDGQFLTFFHSSFYFNFNRKGKVKRGLNYVMGAYTFDQKPPFTIRMMTLAPLGELNDYLKENRRKVVFPCGLVIQEDLIHVVWGKNDCLIMLTTFDKQKLVSSMEPLSHASF